jgi:hypothetical protein
LRIFGNGRFTNGYNTTRRGGFSLNRFKPRAAKRFPIRESELEWSRKSLYGQLRRWFGVLRPGCTVIKSNKKLGEQIGQSRKTVGEGLEELELLRLIHVEGPPKGTRYVYFHRHPWMESPEAVPTWAKLAQQLGPSWAIKKRVKTIKTKNEYSRLMASRNYSGRLKPA